MAVASKPGPRERVYKLKWPVTMGTEVTTELTLRRPKGAEIRKLPTDVAHASMDLILDMAGSLAGVPPSLIDELDAEDVMAVAELIGDFLKSGRKTGGRA